MISCYKSFLITFIVILIFSMSFAVATTADNSTKKIELKDNTKIIKTDSHIKNNKIQDIQNDKKLNKKSSYKKSTQYNNSTFKIKESISSYEKDKKILKKNNKNVKTSNLLREVNITKDNIAKYFKISDGISLNKRSIYANKDYNFNIYYIPDDITFFDIDVTDTSFENNSIKFVAKNNINLSNCGVTISNTFKNVSLENFNFNFNNDYKDSTFIKVDNPTTFCHLNNLTVNVNVENPGASAYVFNLRAQCILENSYINTRLPEYSIDWYHSGDKIPLATTIVNKGSNVVLNNNTINVTSCGPKSESYYSIYGVYNEGYNFTFTNNSLIMNNCTGYAYGLVSRNQKAFISNNHIEVLSYIYSAGINFEGGYVQDNIIQNNYINVTAGDGKSQTGDYCVAYAALLLDYGYSGGTFNSQSSNCKNNSYLNNTIRGHARQFYGFEIYGGYNTNISDNNINATGKTVMGVGIVGENITINNNIVDVQGQTSSAEGSVDYLKPITTGTYTFMSNKGIYITNNIITSHNARGILIASSNNLIVENNTLKTNNYNYSIEISGENNSIQHNALKTDNCSSNDAVKDNNGNNIIQHNAQERSIISMDMPETSIVFDEIFISISLKDYSNYPIAYHNVTLNYENQTINLTTDSQGKTEINFIPKKTGYLTITTVFEGNEEYVRDIVTKKILINEIQQTNTTNTTNGSSNTNKNNTSASNTTNTPTKLSTKITVNPVTATIGKTVTITATIKDQNNKLVSSGSVVFKVNGVKIGESKVTSGTAKVTYSVLNSWISTAPNLEVSYTGNNNYKTSTLSQSGLIKVNKGTAKLTLTTDKTSIKAGEKVTFTVKLTDANTKTGLTDTITIKVNGKSIKANVKKGKATVTYTVPRGTDAQTIKATTTYSSKYHNKATATSKFKVTKTTPTIKKTKITYKNKKTTIKATIKDATKNS
ncbi:MAG: Ig-like domain repeat protein [Methanosphaera sp.]|nr:Ig-like domain repeat protein [Methanosphaera sp.]